MSKQISFFDLDNTLWYIKSDIWLINKNKPSIPIITYLRLPTSYRGTF